MPEGKPKADLIFSGGDIVTLDPANPYIRNAAIAVLGNEIIWIGKADDVDNHFAVARRKVDFSGQVMIPGLIDSHTHLFQSLGKTLGDGLSLLPWLAKFMMPLSANISPADAVATVRMAALNSLLSGTTTLVDNHYAPVDEATILGVADAMAEVGVRGVVARGIYGPMVEGGRRMQSDARLFQYSAAEELEITRACIKARPKGGLVEVWPMPLNVVYVDPDLMVACHELAAEFDLGWQAHCSESKFEVDIFQSVHGVRPARWLHDQGILDDRITLAHGIWFDAEEIEMLGAAKAHVIHNPVCNQYLASGILPLGPLMEAGVNVALGTDGTACVGLNMFESMKSAQVLQRLRELKPDATSSELVLTMATRNGGRMLRRNVGTLKQGALADMTVVDLGGIHHQPAHRPVCCLTLSTMGSDVRHVVVNGEVVVENGRSTRVDQDKVIADCLQASRQLIERAQIGDLVADWIEP
ncbi:MAG: amidohydrolase family protein [Rhodobacteraceae bacterium]|nr:amidohydrolase family protein [Paracoccaceae bacterium]